LFVAELLLGFSDGNFPELLEVLHEVKGSLAGAGASGLVSLLNLSVGVHNESLDLCFDLCDKILHFFKII